MNNKIFKTMLAVALLIQSSLAMASSHREAPLISSDPVADNTDLYAFRSPDNPNMITIIANYIPFELPQGGPNWSSFGENIRYEINIDNDASKPGAEIIYRFTFTKVNEDASTFFNIRLGKQNLKTTYKLERSTNGGVSFTTVISNGIVPPNNIGPRSITGAAGLSAANYKSLMQAAIGTSSTGEKVFCGPIDDPFFVDLGGAFDLGGFRKTGRDGVAKFNCHTIAIQVPISTLQKNGKNVSAAINILDPEFVIGVWATASRPQIETISTTGGNSTYSGDWVQVSRLGMPLTNEAIIPIADKDNWNASNPANDLTYAKYFSNPELALYMDDSQFGAAVPGLADLRIQKKSLGSFDFRNGKKGLYGLKGSSAVAGTALDDAIFGTILLPDSMSPRAVDILPIFYTGVPNMIPYQLATGKGGNPLAAGKPFINNFLPSLGDMLRLNMAVPPTPRNDPKFSSLGLVYAAVLGLTDTAYNGNSNIEMIPNMDGFPNGRRLEDDVTTIELQAVGGVVLAAIGLWYDDYNGSGSPVTAMLGKVLAFHAGVTKNDTTFQTSFPYVQEPWASFRGASYSAPTLPSCGAGTPFGANVLSGNKTISTQTEMNAFFNSVNGNKWTKVTGDLTINGNNSSDPITNMCNLSNLTEVSGYLLIQQFTKSGNPSSVSDLTNLTKAGRLSIITCPSFTTISLPGLTDIAGSFIIRNNRFVKTINAANLASVGGGQFSIIRNHRAESIQFSNTASNFTLSNISESSNVDIQSNGDSAANALTMDFKKITAVAKNFTFANNKNSGVSNFDNIFSGLSTVGGNLIVTNNSSVSKCCIAVNSTVTGSRTISGNTGNCANLTVAVNNCQNLTKRQSNRLKSMKNTDLFSELNIYPSPNNGKFEIGLTTTQTGTLHLTVSDLVGRVVLTQTQVVSGTVSIPVVLDKATEGQYIIKLELNGNVVVKRVQVVK